MRAVIFELWGSWGDYQLNEKISYVRLTSTKACLFVTTDLLLLCRASAVCFRGHSKFVKGYTKFKEAWPASSNPVHTFLGTNPVEQNRIYF